MLKVVFFINNISSFFKTSSSFLWGRFEKLSKAAGPVADTEIALLVVCSENSASTPRAINAQRVGVLSAAAVRSVLGPGSGAVDVPPPQASLRPRRSERGEMGHSLL